MANRQPYKRRQYLVDRNYQIQFVIRSLMVLFAIAAISSLLAMAILWNSMYQPDLERQTHIVSGFLGVAFTLLTELILSVPIVYYLGIRQSHRVVGPINRIIKTLDIIGSGDLSPRLVLREGDVLQSLAKAINQMTENLQKRYPKSST